ncbi:MAG: hypothetical protein ABSA69_09460 [Verrucomicrobiota bacterium]
MKVVVKQWRHGHSAGMPDQTQPDNSESFYCRCVSTVEKVALKSLATGNFAWFVLLAIALACLWKLDHADLKEVLLKVLVTYGWLGYVVAAVTIFVCIRILRWRERFYQQEMGRIADVRNRLMQGKLELPLKSSVEGSERK